MNPYDKLKTRFSGSWWILLIHREPENLVFNAMGATP